MRLGQSRIAPANVLRHFGLSTRLLLLTILFVMVAEVLIYVPSVANFRRTWLNDRLAAAQIAALVLDAAADESLPQALEMRLLAGWEPKPSPFAAAANAHSSLRATCRRRFPRPSISGMRPGPR